MRKIEVPVSFYGKSIKDLNLRAKFGAEVVLIYKPHTGIAEESRVVPIPDYVFSPGDLMLVAGKDQALQRLSRTG